MIVHDNLTQLFVGFQVPDVVQFGLLFARPMIIIAPLALNFRDLFIVPLHEF
jgi:hypothetical protein